MASRDQLVRAVDRSPRKRPRPRRRFTSPTRGMYAARAAAGARRPSGPRRAAAEPPRAGARAARPHRGGGAAPRRSRAASASSAATSSTSSAAPPSSTTSARSRFPTRSSTSPGRSTPTSGSSCASTPSSASASRRRARAGPVSRVVRSSHERWDGSGYPDGLWARRSRSALAGLAVRCLRRDGDRAAVRGGDLAQGGSRGDQALLRKPVRSRDRGRLHGAVRAGAEALTLRARCPRRRLSRSAKPQTAKKALHGGQGGPRDSFVC